MIRLAATLLIEASAEIIFPHCRLLMINRQFRPVIFVDAGNVFQTRIAPEVCGELF